MSPHRLGCGVTPGYGVNYENWWLQVNKGPFADKTFRTAFLKLVDRDLIIKNIYEPLFPGAKAQTCAAWVPTMVYRNEWKETNETDSRRFPTILKLHGSSNWLTSYLRPDGNKLKSLQETPTNDFYV